MRSFTRYILLLALSLLPGWAAAGAAQSPDIEAFVREGCPHCAKAELFLHGLQREQPGLRIVIRDVGRDPAALQRLKQLARHNGETALRVPALQVGGRLLIGYTEGVTDRLIRDELAKSAAAVPPASAAVCAAAPEPLCGPDSVRETETFSIEFLGSTLALDEIGLPLFTVAMGLLDGFNPCSMWVLLLMISLLAPLNNRPRMFAVAGTFIAVQGIAYFLFMAAWLNLFLLVGLSRLSEIVIAALALIAGALNLKDFRGLGRGISLSIPASAKPGIYARMRGVLHADNLAAALIGTVLLGVLVQIIELLCTSGFPALYTRILTLHQPEAFGYYAYLLLYDLAYMLDDMLILIIGIVTLSQHRLQEREGRWLKLLSGLVMVGLGVYLLLY